MSKEQLINYGLLSFALILGGRFIGAAIHAWVDEFFSRSKEKRTHSLDDLIRSRETLYGARQSKLSAIGFSEKPTEETPLSIDDSTDPEELSRRQIMRRVYAFDRPIHPHESEKDQALRLLGLTDMVERAELKRAFKTQAKNFHPDCFDLSLFDGKTKKRLAARIHENYLSIQKAHEYLKKQAS